MAKHYLQTQFNRELVCKFQYLIAIDSAESGTVAGYIYLKHALSVTLVRLVSLLKKKSQNIPRVLSLGEANSIALM